MIKEIGYQGQLEVKATPGALAILERERDNPRTTLAVKRAMFCQDRDLPDQKTTLIIEGGLLSVHFVPERNLALIITAKQAWLGIRPELEQALVDVSPSFAIA
ncbi:MAG: hypothetical protein JSS48_08540 [Nitrospira sp.]|nr:hypothetical protein [Nitrospira sp.]